MLSLIICARASDIPPSLKENVAKTIGVEYEIVVIDNSENRYSIFSAYNLGAQKSKYPYLCFMHDDVAFHTPNWGAKVVAHFIDENTGAIGIAGSPYFPGMPGAWWSSKARNEVTVSNNDGVITPHINYYPHKADKNECVVLDGVWICIRRALFEKIKFDDALFNGFHFYDIDICLQIHQLGNKLYCVFDIWIQHFSIGNPNRNWLDNALLLQKKWRRKLPARCINFSYLQICKFELRALNEYLDALLRDGIAKKDVYKIAAKQLARFWRTYFYYQTPFYIHKYFTKIANYGKD
jgi:GT2 family glycosyltransferase